MDRLGPESVHSILQGAEWHIPGRGDEAEDLQSSVKVLGRRVQAFCQHHSEEKVGLKSHSMFRHLNTGLT